MKKYITYSEDETILAAAKVASGLKPGSIVALMGDLGAGKTAFVRGITKYFAPECNVSSPTFTLVNEYAGKNITVYHFDVYRLNKLSLNECDWIDEYLFGDGICVIEWADRLAGILPRGTITIKIDKRSDLGENAREISIC